MRRVFEEIPLTFESLILPGLWEILGMKKNRKLF